MERKLTKVVDETGNNRTEKMCSCDTDVVKDLCSSESIDTCGNGMFIVQTNGLKALAIFKEE